MGPFSIVMLTCPGVYPKMLVFGGKWCLISAWRTAPGKKGSSKAEIVFFGSFVWCSVMACVRARPAPMVGKDPYVKILHAAKVLPFNSTFWSSLWTASTFNLTSLDLVLQKVFSTSSGYSIRLIAAIRDAKTHFCWIAPAPLSPYPLSAAKGLRHLRTQTLQLAAKVHIFLGVTWCHDAFWELKPPLNHSQ